jgi:transposase-like protein
MRKQTTIGNQASRIGWDSLEEWIRRKVQEFIQFLLEEEISELLGRQKSERRRAVDGSLAYRNGYGKERKLTLGCGTITLRRPRVRGLEERFESKVLPLFARRSKGVSKLIPRLYLHGLALGDFDLALRGLLGENAPVSASTVARLKEEWRSEWHEWKRRSLAELPVVYLWVDGVYVRAGLEKEKAALLVVIGALLNGRKVVLAVEPGYRESTESWFEVLRDLKGRGLNCPRLVVGDGNLGIWAALANIYPAALVCSPVNRFHYLTAFARICSAVFVHTKGLAFSFQRERKAFIASTRWATLSKLLRRIAWLVSMPNQISTMFIQEAPVGVK